MGAGHFVDIQAAYRRQREFLAPLAHGGGKLAICPASAPAPWSWQKAGMRLMGLGGGTIL